MERLRCLFGLDDALHQFAERFLQSASLFSMTAPNDILNLGEVSVTKLHTEGEFQVELVTAQGGYYIPRHVHPYMDSIEVNVAGAVRFVINGDDVFRNVTDSRLLQRSKMRGLRINRHDVHHGQVLPCGAMFLSIQRWHKTPNSVGLDYDGTPLNEAHEHLLASRL
jgi:hypothetical protein